MEFIIKSKDSGITIKDFLRQEINPSRKLLTLAKNKSDGILINGKRVTVRYVLKPGDILHFNFDNFDNSDNLNEPEIAKIVKNESLLALIEIVYEDEYILCVNKPPDMPSHPSFNHFDDTLANAVAAYYFRHNKHNRFHAANRLDRDTSGLVLIAKDKFISAKLNELIKRGEIKKVYQAIVLGDLCKYAKEIGRITAPIKRAQDSIIKRICADDGDYAVTEFKFIKTNGEISLAEVYPITGRTHQIRVHFQSIGFSLLGDDLYFNHYDLTRELSEKYNIKRHALHAVSLEFEHPVLNKNIKIECGLPKDMQKIIKIF